MKDDVEMPKEAAEKENETAVVDDEKASMLAIAEAYEKKKELHNKHELLLSSLLFVRLLNETEYLPLAVLLERHVKEKGLDFDWWLSCERTRAKKELDAIKLQEEYEEEINEEQSNYENKTRRLAKAFDVVFENKIKMYKSNLYVLLINQGWVEAERIFSYVYSTSMPKYSSHTKNEVLSLLSDWHINDELKDLPTKYLVMQNGIYDFESDSFFSFNEAAELLNEYFFTREQAINVYFKRDLKMQEKTKTELFLEELLDEDNAELVLQILAYCLYRSYPIQKAFFFYGHGNNGKSTVIELFRRFLGEQNICSWSLQDLMTNKFALSHLHMKLANMFGDLPSVALERSDILKNLTGGDEIMADRKFNKPIRYKNFAKLIFSANQLPKTHDESMAFFRRIVIVPFRKTIETPDPFVLDKILTEEEKTKLFFKLIDKLKELLRTYQFRYTKSIEEVKKEYKILSNPVVAFIEEAIEEDSNEKLFSDDLYSAYLYFAMRNNIKAMNEIAFMREFNAECKISSKVPIRERKEGKLQRGYRGIRLSEQYVMWLNSKNKNEPQLEF